MLRWMVIAAAVCTMWAAQAQQTGCSDESQCSTGYYCQKDLNLCRECIHCEELHRQPPRGHLACIRSVAECGPCLDGYVDDRLGMGSGCTKSDSDDAVPLYAWVFGGLFIAALLAVAIYIVVYVLRNNFNISVKASTVTSVEAPAAGSAVPPTAPQPPPYDYQPARPASPHTLPAPYAEDPSQPLVKRSLGADGGGGGGGGGVAGGGGAAREVAGSQSARVYANPAYVRNVMPPSYDSAFSDESDHEPFVPHDENTMESVWTPAAHSTIDTNETEATAEATSGASVLPGSAALPALPALPAPAPAPPPPAPRRPSRADTASPPPPKLRCVEDSNNNNNREERCPPAPAAAPAAPAPPTVVVNVLNVNALRQRNDVKL